MKRVSWKMKACLMRESVLSKTQLKLPMGTTGDLTLLTMAAILPMGMLIMAMKETRWLMKETRWLMKKTRWLNSNQKILLRINVRSKAVQIRML